MGFCPAMDMIGDHFTKPLQEALFQKFSPSMPQECVGNNIAHVSVTSLLVSFGQIYILGSYYKIGVCMMVHIKQ